VLGPGNIVVRRGKRKTREKRNIVSLDIETAALRKFLVVSPRQPEHQKARFANIGVGG